MCRGVHFRQPPGKRLQHHDPPPHLLPDQAPERGEVVRGLHHGEHLAPHTPRAVGGAGGGHRQGYYTTHQRW